MVKRNNNPNRAQALNPGFLPSGDPVPSKDLFALVEQLQDGARKVLLSFSGKDSLAVWLYLQENGFDVVPYFCYAVPGLSFDDEMLAYYEDFFKTRIYRFLHPVQVQMLASLNWQPPDTVSSISGMDIQETDYAAIERVIADEENLPPGTFTAVGIRAKDNMMRNRLVHQMGPLGFKKRRYWWAVWDFSIDDVVSIIRRHNCKLSRAYSIWGATGDILDYPTLKLLKQKSPGDYEKVRQMFPLIDAEFFRYEAVR